MPDHQTTTLILAGGKGLRLKGADKGLLTLKAQHLVSYSAALTPKDSQLLVLVNRNLEQYEALGYECITDDSPDYAGPMVAIWQAASNLSTAYLLILPCDMPLLPSDVASQLLAPIMSGDAKASYAKHNDRSHYCCMAAKLSALKKITAAPHSMRHLLEQLGAVAITFDTQAHGFLNVNTKQDLLVAQKHVVGDAEF